MIQYIIKALFFILCISFLGLSSNNSNHTQKSKTQQSRIQNSFTSKSSQPRIVNRKKVSSRSTAKSKKYPPPPKDKSKLPKPIQEHVQAVADLCKIKSFEEQLQTVEAIIEGLRDAVSFYTIQYRKQVNFGTIGLILDNLADDDHISFMWESIFEHRSRTNIVEHFRILHSDLYGIPSTDDDVILLATYWAEPLYRGLYCLSKGYPTQEKIRII